MKMRKIAVVFLVFLMIGVCISCEKGAQTRHNENDSTDLNQITDEISNSDQNCIEDNFETYIVYDRENSPNGYCEVYDNKLVYKNEEIGYMILLPKSWKDNFRVEKSENDWLFFYFWGESDVCYSSKTLERVGLRVFLIANENDYDKTMLDSTYHLGIVNGINYYFAKNTDCSICALYDEIDDYEDGVSIYQDDPEQIKLIREDIRVMEQMQEDLNHMDLDFQVLE